ncbi:GNAT family N-acetyltransferase [Clostridium akagii]|uniref:GNAT family N-acetyltransferase n=1 Tax=Clostridium akagii TaxID=91623 RepID=UPI00068C15D6|nr:GNAT family N-acetyltransferase [Clostridium akagii]
MLYEPRLAVRDDVNTIVELLNKVTLSLHQKNINQWTYPWNFKEINMDIENKNIYVITIAKLIVGTFSIKDMDINAVLHISEPNNLYLYRIAILPEYQGKNIGLEIINYVFKISKNRGKILYLDCYAGNVKLKDFYSRSGFDFCGDFPEEDYVVSVFRFA